jgi:hypothetical protein
MRFFDELLHPEKKCVRVGHNTKRVESRWIVSCSRYLDHFGKKAFCLRCVAHKIKIIKQQCRRCGQVISTEWVDKGSLQGLTLPASEMDQFREIGMVEES